MSRGYTAKGIRERIHLVQLDEAYRLIRRRHQDRPLGTIPTPSRFSDPLGRDSVLYATQSMRCAVWEGLTHDRFARRRRRILALREAEPIVVVTLHTIEPLSLVDLRHDGPVRIGAPTAVTHDADRRAGRSLSAATYANVPERATPPARHPLCSTAHTSSPSTFRYPRFENSKPALPWRPPNTASTKKLSLVSPNKT